MLHYFKEENDEYVLELPYSWSEKGVETKIFLEGRRIYEKNSSETLTVTAKYVLEIGKTAYNHKERFSLTLPDNCDADTLVAEKKNGIIRIRIKRKDNGKRRSDN